MPTVPAPQFLFLSINEMCNLHCRHCDYWRTQAELPDRIGQEKREEILAEFAELSPGGRVVICGGEPMLSLDAYYGVCKASRMLGLRTLSVINGTQVVTDEDADRLVLQGPDEVSLSLDGPTEEIHDRARGTVGSYVKTTAALAKILEARKRTGSDVKVYVMGLLTASTYRLLDSFYALVLDCLGADKLKLNGLQPSFLNTRLEQFRARDDYFATESQVDPDVLQQMLDRCEKLFRLNYNPEWKKQVVTYFAGLWKRDRLYLGWRGGFETRDHICNTAERNIMVDVRGRAQLCFGTQFPHWQLKEKGDLRRVWEEWGQETRCKMARCNALCGISHSVRREHATLPAQSWSLANDQQTLDRLYRSESKEGGPGRG